jgi:hypothetical protein
VSASQAESREFDPRRPLQFPFSLFEPDAAELSHFEVMTYFDPSTYRSPETKGEVKAAARILLGLAAIFIVIGAICAIPGFFESRSDGLIITGSTWFAGILCGAGGAYNFFYTRNMRHASFMAAALARPNWTVAGIILIICAGTALLAYLINVLR